MPLVLTRPPPAFAPPPGPLDGGAGAVDPRDGLGDLGLGDDQRRHQPRDVVAGADRQQLLGPECVDQLAIQTTLCRADQQLSRAPQEITRMQSLISASRCLNSGA